VAPSFPFVWGERYDARRFPGAFAKFQNATVTFGIPVHLSGCINKLGSQWILMKFGIWVFFRKYVEKTQISLNLTIITATVNE